jgi:hypothetical protein
MHLGLDRGRSSLPLICEDSSHQLAGVLFPTSSSSSTHLQMCDVKHMTATSTRHLSPPRQKTRCATHACPNGLKHGALLVDFADGATYHGEWSFDKRYFALLRREPTIRHVSSGFRHGHGKMTYPDGSSYVRFWRPHPLAWPMRSLKGHRWARGSTTRSTATA